MFTVNFKRADFARLMFAFAKVESMVMLEENELPKRCAQDMRLLLVSNIMSQKFQSMWPAHNRKYMLWKSIFAPYKTGFWRLWGDLVKSLSVFQHDGAWVAGVTPGAMDRGGKSWFGTGNVGPAKSIAWYGALMEWGTHKQPARPLFEPTMLEYRVTKFPQRGAESLRKIGFAWS